MLRAIWGSIKVLVTILQHLLDINDDLCKKKVDSQFEPFCCTISDQQNKLQEQSDENVEAQNKVDPSNVNQQANEYKENILEKDEPSNHNTVDQPAGDKQDEAVREMVVDEAKTEANAGEQALKFSSQSTDTARDEAFQDETEHDEDSNTLDNMDYKEEKDDSDHDDDEDDEEEDEEDKHTEDHREEEDKTDVKDTVPVPPVEPPTKLEEQVLQTGEEERQEGHTLQAGEELKREDQIVQTGEPRKEDDQIVTPREPEEHIAETEDLKKDEALSAQTGELEKEGKEDSKPSTTIDTTLGREAETAKQESEPTDGGGSLFGNMFNGKSTEFVKKL